MGIFWQSLRALHVVSIAYFSMCFSVISFSLIGHVLYHFLGCILKLVSQVKHAASGKIINKYSYTCLIINVTVFKCVLDLFVLCIMSFYLYENEAPNNYSMF